MNHNRKDNRNIRRGLKTKLITLAGILGLTFTPLKSQDDSLKVNYNNFLKSNPNIVQKLKYTDDSTETTKKDNLNTKDSLLLDSKNVENLIEKIYQTKKRKKITQKEKDKIGEIHSFYSDSTKNNKYGLSANSISNLFEIKNALDLKEEIKSLSLSIGEDNNFRDDSRKEVRSSFLKVFNLYSLLNEKEQKSNLTNKILGDTWTYIRELKSLTSTFLEEEYDVNNEIYAPGLSQRVKEDLETDLNYGIEIISQTSNILNESDNTQKAKQKKNYNRQSKDYKNKKEEYPEITYEDLSKKYEALLLTKRPKKDYDSFVNFNVGYGSIIDGKSYAKLGLDTRILRNTKLNISAITHYSTNEGSNPETTLDLPDGSTIFEQESFKEESNGIGGQISLEQEFFKYLGVGLKYVYIPIKNDITTIKNENQTFSDGTTTQNSTTVMSFDKEDVLYAGIEGKIRVPYKNLEIVFKPGIFYNFEYNPNEGELDKKLDISSKPSYGLELELSIKP
jgi:hypothetical protein